MTGSLQTMMGAAGQLPMTAVNLFAVNSNTLVGGTVATAQYYLMRNGEVYAQETSNAAILKGLYASGGAAAGDPYSIFATLKAGALTSGTLNAWLPLTGQVLWQVNRSGLGIATATITVKIRRNTDSAETPPVDITFKAQVA